MIYYLYTLDYDEIEGKLVRPFWQTNESPAEATSKCSREGADLEKRATNDRSTTSDQTSEMSEVDLRERCLSINIRVYAIADKYDIGLLKELAEAKFSALLDDFPPTTYLPDITKEVFTLCPPHDHGLQVTIIEFCKENLEQVMKDVNMRLVILDFPSLALAMMDASTDLLERRASIQHSLIEQVKSEKQLVEKLEAVVRMQGKHCRHCHEPFNGYLEKPNRLSDEEYILRCGGCRTKHYL